MVGYFVVDIIRQDGQHQGRRSQDLKTGREDAFYGYPYLAIDYPFDLAPQFLDCPDRNFEREAVETGHEDIRVLSLL